MNKNRRRNDRFVPSNAVITLKWRGVSEQARFASARVLNYSETGLRIELCESIAPRTYVMLGAHGQNRAGWAGWVRYCSRRGIKYIVGLELSAGPRWMDFGDSTLEGEASFA
jgi:hypothetical protein